MKLDKDMIWIGGLGLVLYLLASKKSDGTSPALTETGTPDDTALRKPTSSNGAKKPSKKKPSSSVPASPQAPSGGGGSDSVESRARKAAMDKLKESFQNGGETALTASFSAADVYEAEGGDVTRTSPFYKQLIALSEMKDTPFSTTDITIDELSDEIQLTSDQISAIKAKRTALGEERRKIALIKKDIDEASWFSSGVPSRIIEINKLIDELTAEIAPLEELMNGDIEYKKNKLAVIAIVRNLTKLAS